MIRSQSKSTRHFVLFVMLGCFVAPVAADDEIKFPTKTAECVVSVADEAGKPIAGAKIKPYGCRCEEEPTTGWAWPTANVGKPQEVTTDAQGKATLAYPIKFGADPDWMTTSQVSVLVGHPEYIGRGFHFDPRDRVSAVMLKPGCQLTFSAVDRAGARIDFGILMAGPGRSAKWVQDDSGGKRSRAIPDGVWQTMMVSPAADGQHLFSNVLPIRLRDNQDVSVRNVRLQPGLRLHGRLSDDVPRPIANGKVVAHCLPKPAGDSYDDDDPSVTWETAVKIEADGTFVFPSLPRTGMVQLITVCNGFLGTNTNVPKANPGFTQGLFVDLDAVDDADGVTIPMQATGTVKVQVVRPDGQPLAGANVVMCPNHLLHLTGSTIVGASWETLEEILVQLDSDRELPKPDHGDGRYMAKTDADGIAIISDLPTGGSQSIYAAHDDFVIPAAKGRPDRQVMVGVPDADPVDVVIKMVSVQSANEESAKRARVKAAQQAAGELGDAAQQAADGVLNAAADAADSIGEFFKK